MKLPTKMFDALSRNLAGYFNTLLANCLAYGRQNFVDIAWKFAEECTNMLEELKKL